MGGLGTGIWTEEDKHLSISVFYQPAVVSSEIISELDLPDDLAVLT